MGRGSAISVFGSRALCAALRPTRALDRALHYNRATGPCPPLSARVALTTHCERSGARSKSWASVRPISMPLDVLSLQSFYGSPLGGVARRLIGRVIRERWTSSAGLSIAAVGYGAPYLERFRDGARRCLALMPAEQGVVVWPEAGRCAAALVDAQMLPLPDGSIDRLLLAHALEAADRPDALLEESMAHHRAGGTNDRDRSLPPGRLGAHGQHALWTGLALFEIAAARLASTGGLLADLLGRGALRAPGRRSPS